MLLNCLYVNTASTKQQRFIVQHYAAAKQAEQQACVPAYIAIAQAAYESKWGSSRLAQEANNLHGLRWYAGHTVDNHATAAGGRLWQCYESKAGSFAGWAGWINLYLQHADCYYSDIECWATAVRRAGYAGSKNVAYQKAIIKIVKQNKIHELCEH